MSDPYKLYFTPGACSISPNIALREAGLPFELVKIDLRNKTAANGEDWMKVNPKGYVPALKLPTGELLTEGAIMVQYIADQAPASKLAPASGTFERVRLNEMLHFIATELHKQASPLYNALASDELKTSIRNRLVGRYDVLSETLGTKPYLTGDTFTVADGYAFYVLRTWLRTLKQTLDKWPNLVAYYDRVAKRPAVAAALESESLQP
jgi:glutathione S-transferase